MGKHALSEKDALPVEQALPDNPPLGPNHPANMEAMARAGAAESVRINNARTAQRNAVIRGETGPV